MAVSDLLDEREAAPENIGPTLRRAREAAGYSITDLAERMRLSRHHIENLEAERFNLFPVSVFLRGYLTSYARLVGIDAGPLLEAYDRRGFGPPQLHSQETDRTTARGSEFTVTVTSLVVVAVLIILSALWWRDQWTGNDGLPAPTVATPDEGGASQEVEEGSGEPAGGSHPSVEPGPEAPSVRDDTAQAPDLEPPPVAAGLEPPPVSAGGSAPDAAGEAPAVPAPGADAPAPAEGAPRRNEGPEAPVETVAGEGSEPAPAPLPAPATPEAAEAGESGAAGEAERPPTGEEGALASLVIRVREDCWLMIRGADQRLVYRNLAPAGTVLDLAAMPPIRIVAGYASGIEIEYNGEPFDPSPYVEQDTGTARFRLGS